MSDPHATLRDEVLGQVLDGPAESAPALRHAAAGGPALPPDLRTLVDKIHAHAYRVTDADVAAAQATYGDDVMFEVIVSAALGASNARLRAALSALEAA